MGRLAKNHTISNGITQSLQLPVGETSRRPLNPTAGSFRYSTSNDKMEIFNGTEWRSIGTEGTLAITKDTFTGDGSSTVFGPMSFTKQYGEEARVIVYVGNVAQNPGVAYTFDGSGNITFTSPPPNAHSIVVIHGFDSTVAE